MIVAQCKDAEEQTIKYSGFLLILHFQYLNRVKTNQPAESAFQPVDF